MKKGIIILTITIGLLILLSDEVKADSLYTNIYNTWYSDQAHNNILPTNDEFQYYEPTANYSGIGTLTYYGRSFTKSGDYDYVQIPYLITGRFWTTASTFSDREIVCKWEQLQDAIGNYYYEPYDCTYYGTGNYSSPVDIDFTFTASLYNSNGNQSACEVKNGFINCQLEPNVGYDMLVIRYSQSGASTSSTPIRMNIGRVNGLYKTANSQIIENQESIINNQQQILEQNATYENTPDQDLTNETQEIEQYHQAEENLINSLDLNMSVMDGISINPNASSYIWSIVERLRMINPAIILLMTSILGMGIIKMVLNR